MIVQDEEECLRRALDSIEAYVDEIIVVDGGSSDSTKEIALSYDKVKLFEIPFPGDFSKQRNVSLEKASGKWILVLDADEYLDDYVVSNLQRLIEDEAHDAYAFSRKTFIDGCLVNIYEPDYQIRLFRNYCRYEDKKIHEAVIGFKNLQKCNLDIKHYKKAEWQQKDNERYWDMGHPPPEGWEKIDGKWVCVKENNA